MYLKITNLGTCYLASRRDASVFRLSRVYLYARACVTGCVALYIKFIVGHAHGCLFAVWSGVSVAGVAPGGVSARLAHQFHHLGHHLRVLLEEGVELVLVLHERLQLLLGHTDDGRAVRAVASSSRWQGRLATAG